MDPEDLKNYRPVSNLKFLSKTVERAAVSQMQNYLSTNNLNATMQSAYRKNHSCETALLRVINDLLLALDSGQEAVLLLLDYTAAFDTINHNILFDRLEQRFGFHNNALKWLQSYFTNRSQSVVIGDQISSNQFPRRGAP